MVVPIAQLLLGVLLVYGILRPAVVGALRDHHKRVERRSEKMLPPAPGPDRNVPYDHNI